jgi:integrase
VSHAFHRAATKAGLAGVRLHDLRHAFCTQLVEAGVAASIVSQVAGHANPGFTLSTYVHHDEEAARQVADAMEAALGKDWAK